MYSGSVRWFGQIFFVGPASFGIWCCIGYAGLKIVLLYCMHATIFVLGFGLSLVLGALGLHWFAPQSKKGAQHQHLRYPISSKEKRSFLSQPRCADELPSCHQTVGRRLPWMSEWRSRQQKALAPRHPPTLLQQKVHQPIDTEWVLLSSLLFFLQQKSLCPSTHLYSL